VVSIPSFDRSSSGAPLVLKGYWTPASAGHLAERRAGAVMLLHGCSGPYQADGALSSRMRSYTQHLNDRGWSVLVLDSLTPRGERELCTQRMGTRRVTQANRRLDAWAGLTWMAGQPNVDARHLGMIGWSNGGSTVLAALQADRFARRPEGVPVPAFAVAYYPGCMELQRAGQWPVAPLLLQLGQSDDWTPAQPCLDWAQDLKNARGLGEADLEVALYPAAYHGFDGDGPVRLRRDVPNGVSPGQGVHVGGDPQARQASRERLNQWLLRFRSVQPGPP
jgi:dienelactone hydrolase